ncbi:Translation initiation factor 3 subunit c [Boothiomyces macroporosus]|uniref:Eukaryotic translation initiation factor 3 subunit C n=1 Tax=Boothiomyces macroporosus TaxID=261099 RepID=A0AAD5UNW9_9FUNG|nr:Translation initiation factor 3 subunit c [Boothiomyces macroporosus]
MSRFFAASDSESSDDEFDKSSDAFTDQSDSEMSDEPEVEDDQPSGISKWLKKTEDESDSDSEGPKQIKSAKEKRFDELRDITQTLLNALEFDDFVTVNNEYDKLQKSLVKADAIIKREGIPRFYIRTINTIDDVLKNYEKDPSMNASSTKALNAMKQKLKKELKLREVELERFRENPVDEAASEFEAQELAQEREEERAAMESAKKTKKVEFEEDGFTAVSKGKAIPTTADVNLFEVLNQVLDARGKKNTDKLAQIETLVRLKKSAKTQYQRVIVLNLLIPTRFDYVPPVTGCMSTDMWQSALEEIKALYDLLDKNPNIKIGPFDDNEETEQAKDKLATKGEAVKVRGNIASFVDRLDDEFLKSLQNIDPHTTEYIDRLRDETPLYCLLVRALKYAESTNESQDILDLMLMRRVEHLYYKPDSIIEAFEAAVQTEYSFGTENLKIDQLVAHYCTLLYKTNIDRIRVRALLCHVYHVALHDDYHKARDMILMSRLQETITQSDIPTQTLYNRSLVQIGLCAFRKGLYKEAHTVLQEICSVGKTKELLAQGVSSQKFVEKTPEQEKLDKSRQLPFHMHVNLELLECVYLVSAMLLEIPNMALNSHDSRRKMISKSFRRMLEYNERQVFIGPPENNRDHIMAAAKSMASGNWQAARDFVLAVKVWDLLPNSESIKKSLTDAIQVESLKTYIFTYAPFYESLDIATLSSMFRLDEQKTTSVVSKLIVNEQLQAHIDPKSKSIHLSRSAPGICSTRLEYLSSHFAEKISILVDANEKVLESKTGTDEKFKKPNRKQEVRFRG